ncbi:MAG: energy-coupling factor ABC transporter permease, partial [Muribaculaceae bacterium]|nr:energy-coupling factor ABC transporter permease [Muribaculaceae bacterium]
MHMADALISTPVALTAGLAATALLGVAGYKVNKEKSDNVKMVPLMGVLGAFVFAAQMINFSIPGTGSSGHIIGGILLAAFLGPWAAFLTIASVLIIQCLVFADGGLLALGCNIINMGAMTT